MRRWAGLAPNGIFDYWGCPDTLLDDVVAVVQRLRARGTTA
jgi:hypothetical protein